MTWRVLVLVLGAAVAACGDNTAGNTAADAALPPDGPPAFHEAAHGSAPALVSLGGPVLKTPKVQPIFFANDDTTQAALEDFLGKLAGSSYWHDTTSEYGVGDLTTLPTIVTTDAPPTTDTTLAAFIAGKLDGTHTAEGFPAAPDAQTIYALYTPDGAVVTGSFGNSCQAYGGYHDEVAGAHGEKITYAFMPRCQGIDSLTITTSHELVEAATDPHPETEPAFGSSDADHAVMSVIPGAEAGDYCEYLPTADTKMSGYFVQRTWSNAASAAGTDPCVPALGGPFVAGAPTLTDAVVLQGFGGSVTTKGVAVPLNGSKTIDVQLFSDVDTTGFDVAAFDAATLMGGTAELTLAFDKTHGKNGDVVHLTITRTANGQFGGSEFAVIGKFDGAVSSILWGYASN